MNSSGQLFSRRQFLGRTAGFFAGFSMMGFGKSFAGEVSPVPEAEPPTLTRISGPPSERGRKYGEIFGEGMKEFLEQEIWEKFVTPENTRDRLLGYASGCLSEIRKYSPMLAEEMDGMSRGSGLRIEEVVLLASHEELYHRGTLPPISHCTAVAAGPPDTKSGETYVAQSWDWMKSVYGRSGIVLWERPEGPDVLAYHYPGLWISAGLNSEGIGLVWTSAALDKSGPRVGIPTYSLIAQMLYQQTIEDAVEEARRARRAGWFAFVLADGKGRLASVEGDLNEFAVEYTRGHFARVYYGTHKLTHTPEGQEVPQHPQCRRMNDLLDSESGNLDGETIRRFYGDHESTICKHLSPERGGGTLDVMVFNTTRREVSITRGPACKPDWRTFTFGDSKS